MGTQARVLVPCQDQVSWRSDLTSNLGFFKRNAPPTKTLWVGFSWEWQKQKRTAFHLGRICQGLQSKPHKSVRFCDLNLTLAPRSYVLKHHLEGIVRGGGPSATETSTVHLLYSRTQSSVARSLSIIRVIGI